MSVESFLDSNVFIYIFDETDLHKQQQAEKLVYQSIEDGTGCISFQVIQETLNIVIRKLGASSEDSRRLMHDVLFPLWRVRPSKEFYQSGLELKYRYNFSFYDSLIVAAALEAGCKTLYSEDLQDGQRVDSLTIRNPFPN